MKLDQTLITRRSTDSEVHDLLYKKFHIRSKPHLVQNREPTCNLNRSEQLHARLRPPQRYCNGYDMEISCCPSASCNRFQTRK